MSLLDHFINRKPVILHENDTAYAAAKAMLARNIGSVLVACHHGGITGIVTDRDLVHCMLGAPFGPNSMLRDMMTRAIHCVTPDASVQDVIEVMKKYGVRRVPVLTNEKEDVRKCCGVVSLDDLVAVQAVSSNDLAQIVKAQIFLREAVSRPTTFEAEPFLKELRRHLHNSEAELDQFASKVFETVFRRLHYSSAIQFMLQLPEKYQKQLIRAPAGPDPKFTAGVLASEVQIALKIAVEAVPSALHKLWVTLGHFGDSNELQNVMAHLPEDMAELFMENQRPLRLSEDMKALYVG